MRGNTQRALVRMLREAGAAEVHVRISSPPVRWPCFYGIDFATRAELIATGLGVEEIRASIGADSLGYIARRAWSRRPASRASGSAAPASTASTRCDPLPRSLELPAASTCSRRCPGDDRLGRRRRRRGTRRRRRR